MTLRKDDKWNLQIYEQACDWLVAFRTGTPDLALREPFDEWLRRSPEHVRAYLELSSLWEDAAFHDPERKVDAPELIARARAEGNVVSLGAAVPHSARLTPTPGEGRVSSTRVTSARGRRLRMAMAAVVLILLGTALGGWLYTERNTYSTAIGEQRSLTLDDGSVIELNARSRLKVHFTDHERTVDLIQGQALFTVSKDPSRPFVVRSDGTTVRAVGTEFDVYRRASGTRVTVLEGTVAVSARNSIPLSGDGGRRPGAGPQDAASLVMVKAAQQITVTTTGTATPIQSANLVATTAWTQRRLIFDSAPLSEVVEEFNRYNRRPLVISDPAVASVTVVGVFSSTDPSSLIRFLESQPGIEVVKGASEIRVSSRQTPDSASAR